MLVIGLIAASGPVAFAQESTTVVGQLPEPLDATSAVWTGDVALVMGGWDGIACTRSVLAFDPEAGTTIQVAELPDCAYDAAAVWTGSRVLVFGGRTENGPVRTIRIVDPATGAVSTSRATLPTSTFGAAAVYAHGQAYVIGGFGSSFTPSRAIYRFDPVKDEATTLPTSLPFGWAFGGAAWVGDAAVLLGGLQGAAGVMQVALRFDPLNGTVAPTRASTPELIRVGPSVAFDGTRVLVFGGSQDASGGASDRIVAFDPAADSVQAIAATLPSPRAYSSAVWAGDAAFVFGGSEGSARLSEIVRFEPRRAAPEFALSQFAGVPATARADDALDASVTVENVGDSPGVAAVRLLVDGVVANATDVELEPRASSALAWRFRVTDPGTHVVTVSVVGGPSTTARGLTIERVRVEERTLSTDATPTDGSTVLADGDRIVPPLRGSVVDIEGIGLAAVPLLLLRPGDDGALRAVASAQSGPDGRFEAPASDDRPEYVAAFRNGHLTLQPVGPAGAASSPLAPLRLPASIAGPPLDSAQFLRLVDSFEEARIFPVGTIAAGTSTDVFVGRYLGIDHVLVDAAATNASLVVAKLKDKGLDEIPDPPGRPLRWLGIALLDGSGREVEVHAARIDFVAPPGAGGRDPVALHRFRAPEAIWDSIEPPSSQGVYSASVPSLSLFAIGTVPASGLVGALPFAIGGLAFVALAGSAYYVVGRRRRRRSQSRPVPGAGAAHATSAAAFGRPVELGDDEFVASGVRVSAGGTTILDDVSFGFRRGEILALIGPSGSGKSTLLKSIVGDVAFSGEVSVFGLDPRTAREELKAVVGYVSQDTQLYPDMTVKENVEYFASQYGLAPADAAQRSTALLATLGLEERAGTRVGVLSGGQQRRASIAATLVAGPTLLILDEPTSGLDPVTRRNLWSFVRQANRELGVSVIVTTHFLDEAELADRVVLIHRGKVVSTGSPAQLVKALPGGGRVVAVELSVASKTTDARIREAAAALVARGVVQKLDLNGYSARFFAGDPQAASREVLAMLQSIDVPVRALTTEVCTLEDVFVHGTGEAWVGPPA